MMNDEDLFGGLQPDFDDESGSAYENSESGHNAPPDEKKYHASGKKDKSTSRSKEESHASSVRSRSRSHKSPSSASDSEVNSDSEDHDELSPQKSPTPGTKIREDAIRWALDFQAPESPSQIKEPTRHAISRRKRKAKKSANQARAKRVKVYYNTKYQDLLNQDIHYTTTKIDDGDVTIFSQSQVGAASVWTSLEKAVFFSSLDRLGQDNIRGIAEKIGTKSEVQVHEYIILLRDESTKRKERYGLDIEAPAAFEINQECCAALERAGDALASRQERHEEKVEEGKWGDSWLVTKNNAGRLSKQRKRDEYTEFDEAFPASNLFNFKKWLELSENIFMNSASPYDEDNWHSLVELGETPAVRATAFQDFHSLTVSITKRVISAVLFCTMSRQRAMSSKSVKHADVNDDDVEAALNILGMKKDSHEFWRKAARRCRLQIQDNDASRTGTSETLTYDEVEDSLKARGQRSRSRSRSRSMGRPLNQREKLSPMPSNSGSSILENDLLDSSDLDISDSSSSTNIPNPNSGSDSNTTNPANPIRIKRLSKRRLQAQESNLNTNDLNTSKEEETRLWDLLSQTPLCSVKAETFEIPEKMPRRRRDEGSDWREKTDFRSEWESFERPVAEEKFVRNRERVKRRTRGEADREVDVGSELEAERDEVMTERVSEVGEDNSENYESDEEGEDNGDDDESGKESEGDDEKGSEEDSDTIMEEQENIEESNKEDVVVELDLERNYSSQEKFQ